MEKGGLIEFVRPEGCTQKRHIHEMKIKQFNDNEFSGLMEFVGEEAEA